MEGKQGGTKNAAALVNDYIRRNLKNLSEEELRGMRILVAFAAQQEDAVPELWHCDTDCRNTNHSECPGQFSLDLKSKKLCPYYSDMLF